MSSDGFRVDPEALFQVAARLEQAADQLDREIAIFARSSQSARADAFGLLPAGQAAHRAYLQKAEEALRGLRAIQATLAADLAGGLRATAANYVAADEEGVPRPP